MSTVDPRRAVVDARQRRDSRARAFACDDRDPFAERTRGPTASIDSDCREGSPW